MQNLSRVLIGVAAGSMCLHFGCVDGILTSKPDPDDPFQGRWKERSSVSCADGAETPGTVEEIIFSQGRFSVTQFPFETFIDYWGDYELNPETNELTMTVTGGNTILDDVDLSGTVEFQDDGSIVLRDIYLGTWDNGSVSGEDSADPSAATCSHVLEPL